MMKTEAHRNTVAVYWDFENLHACLYEEEWGGAKSYQFQRYSPQDELIDISAIMDYALSIGDIAINRAYNNWQWFLKYRDGLNRFGIDLIQLYPKGNFAKNGADIRLALDVLEDVFRFPKLTHIIIISSDSDYISLTQKLKQSGIEVIGIGVEQKTNPYWAQCCDEFKFYNTLLGFMAEARRPGPPRAMGEKAEAEVVAVKPLTLEDARKLMLDALRRLVAQKGEEQVPRGTLKDMMKRMESTFDEASLGFFSFSAFLKTFPDEIEEIPDKSGGKVRLRSAAEQATAKSEPSQDVPLATEQDYELILKRGNVRLLPSPWWRAAVQIVDEIFKEAAQSRLTSFDHLEGELAARLDAAGLDGDEEMAHRLRGFLYSLQQFQLDRENQTIRLKASGGDTLLYCVEREMVRRIVRFAAPPVDISKVAAILYGEDTPNRLEDAQRLIDLFTKAAG